MDVLRSMAGPAAMYTSIHLTMNCFCCPHSVFTGLVFSQVSFVFHSGKIKTGFNVYFVVAVVLRLIVYVIFQFHGEWCFNCCPKIETEPPLFLWETVKAIIHCNNIYPAYIIPLSLQKATNCSFLVKFRVSFIWLSFFSTLLNPDGFIWCS